MLASTNDIIIFLIEANLLIFMVCPFVKGDAKAGFLENFPRQVNEEDTMQYYDYTIHDADVKIPGRHVPKLPYVMPITESNKQTLDLSFDPNGMDQEITFRSYGDIKDLPQGDGLKPPTGPHFDRDMKRNITVQAGKTAMLSCRVRDISQKSVSWIRLRDLHILSVDKYKYSTDQRISVEYNESKGEWLLRIVGVKHLDAGKYECQVSTKPVLSFIVNMDVVDELLSTERPTFYPRMNDQTSDNCVLEVPEAYIVNSPDIHVHLGSLINLTCVVNHGKNQPVYIYWYHENKIVDLDNGRMSVDMMTPTKGQTVSQLVVKRARLLDSGKYACKPSNGDQTEVTLHVLKGEMHAAMQTNSATSASVFVAVILSMAISISL